VLGHSHAVSGAVTGAAVGEFILHLPVSGVGALAYLAAAWATVPDLDTRGSCAARSLGFFSEAFAWTVGKLARGHRHGTHSILGVAVLTALTWLACTYRHTQPGRWGLMLLLAIALAGGMRALRLGGHAADAIAIGIAVGITLAGWELALVPLGCALGCATHIAGDMLTDSGAPLLWPVVDYRFKWWPEPFAFTTGTRPETVIIVPALTAGLFFLAWHAVVLPPVIPR
jgi:membrane-bound metal-dependent hydrolase YbcI (DUF457 family)